MFIKITSILLGIFLSSSLFAGQHQSIRATDMKDEFLNKFQRGEIQDTTIEFRENDRLPVNIKAEGDLFESADETPTFIEIKKNFFINIKNNKMTMSFDGETFKPIKELVGGSITANASANGHLEPSFPASSINIIFSTFIK